MKKRKKRKRMKKKLKKKLKKSASKKKGHDKKKSKEKVPKQDTREIEPELTEKAKAMAPMTKETWEKRQSIIRKIYDQETGRYRWLYRLLKSLLLDTRSETDNM